MEVYLATTVFQDQLRQSCLHQTHHPLPGHFLIRNRPPPSSFVSNTDVGPFTAHAPLDHVGETVALNLSSSSPTSQKTTNPQHSSPSLHAGIPLATVVWWCLPSNQTLSFLYGHIALALQTRQVKIPCSLQVPCMSHLPIPDSCSSLSFTRSFICSDVIFDQMGSKFRAVHKIPEESAD